MRAIEEFTIPEVKLHNRIERLKSYEPEKARELEESLRRGITEGEMERAWILLTSLDLA